MTTPPFSQRVRAAFDLLVGKSSWHQMFNRPGLFGGTMEGTRTTKPMQQSVWVNSACQLVAGPIKSLPVEWKDAMGNPVEDGERAMFWGRPAMRSEGRMSWTSFIEASVIWYLLDGEACWILDDTWLTRSSSKSPLILARPDRLRAVMKAGVLVGWQYQDGAKGQHVLLPEQVIRTVAFNPYDDIRGLGRLDAARVAVDADYAAGLFSKHISQSNGDRGVYVIAKSGIVDDAQKQQIERALREKRELNQRGVYKAAFLTGDITVEDPKIQAVDQAFLNQRIENRHEIFAAFGVPMSMADITASYSVGSASDRYRLKEDTCMPISCDLMESVEQVERMRSGVELKACQDWSNDSTMREARDERLKTAATVHVRGVPWQNLDEVLDLGLGDFPGKGEAWLPMALQPVGGMSEEGSGMRDEGSEIEDGDVALSVQRACSRLEAAMQARKNDAQKRDSSAPDAPGAVLTLGCGCDAHAAPASSLQGREPESEDEKRRRKLWESHMKARAGSVKAVQAQVSKTVMEARKEVLANLEAIDLDNRKARGLVDVVFDLAKFTASMISRLNGVLTGTLEEAAAQLGEELQSSDPWVLESDRVINFLNSRENRIKGASEEIFAEIAATIQEGLEAGDGNAEIAKRLREKFTGISKVRAMMIAQTEVTAAYGYARQIGFEELGVTTKEWLSSRDGRVRPTHVEADGQKVGVRERFVVGSAELLGPGDVNGPAAEVINCRCVSIAVA